MNIISSSWDAIAFHSQKENNKIKIIEENLKNFHLDPDDDGPYVRILISCVGLIEPRSISESEQSPQN
ncbi:hypothetical protein DERP_011418 [Dermatophagoides pteronyssinus]|uniref:Uncharacterized protein n=1 Tax=Dermatophagoides pteronyssinus TaxID=6956 RepID=A0ABQ8J5B1_DERPT|nr:hypothetical protein DERP_011418 [Dermatophagoides pteronyssinus]